MMITRQSLAEHFGRLNNDELVTEFQSGELTELAREVAAAEIQSRSIDISQHQARLPEPRPRRGYGLTPRFSSVDVLFKRTPEGWTFNASYPRYFGPWSTYLLTDLQKAALEEGLNRFVLMAIILACTLGVLLGVFVQFMVPDFADRLVADSPGAWLLLGVVSIVLTSVLAPSAHFFRHRVIESVLCTARRIGPARPDWLGFIRLVETIKRCTERRSARVLIIWTVLLLLFSAYGTIVDALVAPARSFVVVFANVGSWLMTLCCAALLVLKLRAQRSRR
jgi:hypothetical protein